MLKIQPSILTNPIRSYGFHQ